MKKEQKKKKDIIVFKNTLTQFKIFIYVNINNLC